ncbi:hypothetical protein M885DRAFT_531155, partial [Pelagophyceae sp. CCMP2097]
MGHSSSALERQIASPARRPNVTLECARPDFYFCCPRPDVALAACARGHGADAVDPQTQTWCRCGLCVRELPYGAAAVAHLAQGVHLVGRAESHRFVSELLFGVAAIPTVSSSMIESLTAAFLSAQSPAQPAVVRESVRYLERDHLHAIVAVVRLADERLRRRCGSPGPLG